jgi:aminopeptidase N
MVLRNFSRSAICRLCASGRWEPDLKQVAFATSPKMSTYLFVLTVGELERITAEVDGVTVGVVATAGKAVK